MLVKVESEGTWSERLTGVAVAEFGKDGGRQEQVEQRTAQRMMEMRDLRGQEELVLGELPRETKDREHDEFGYDTLWRVQWAFKFRTIYCFKKSPPHPVHSLSPLSLNVHHPFHHSGLTSQLLLSF